MPRSVVRGVQRYVDELDANLEQGRGLWFQGPHGTGKTTLAMLVSKSALAAGRSAAVYSVPRLLAELRDTFDDDAEMSATQLIDRLTAVELLHLDDLGAERTSAWVLEQLYSLINARYEAERAILVTTNLEREELIEQIGARSVSRLTEMCTEIPLHGDDHRLTAGMPAAPTVGTFEAQRIAELRTIGARGRREETGAAPADAAAPTERPGRLRRAPGRAPGRHAPLGDARPRRRCLVATARASREPRAPQLARGKPGRPTCGARRPAGPSSRATVVLGSPRTLAARRRITPAYGRRPPAWRGVLRMAFAREHPSRTLGRLEFSAQCQAS